MKKCIVVIDGWEITLTQEDNPERFMAEAWYRTEIQQLATAQASTPERAVKKAFQNLAYQVYRVPPRHCAICEEHMGDDIECYKAECDETIRKLIPEKWNDA